MDPLVSILIVNYVIPALGTAIVALAGMGIAMLKKKIKSEEAKTALDQVDQVVGVVVGNLAQVTAKKLKIATADGKLTDEEKDELRRAAIGDTKRLLREEVLKAATKSISSIDDYIEKKVEERVLAIKK